MSSRATRCYDFREVSPADLPLLTKWQTQPHVLEWWDTDAPYNEDDLNDPRVSRWIVSCDKRAFAYMQDYTVHGWPDHHFAGLPIGSRGIDQFIGEPDMVGQGHGTAFMREHLQKLFKEGTPVIGTDPHPHNARAIAAYGKLGFKAIGPPQDTQWGLILPMTVTPKTKAPSFLLPKIPRGRRQRRRGQSPHLSDGRRPFETKKTTQKGGPCKF